MQPNDDTTGLSLEVSSLLKSADHWLKNFDRVEKGLSAEVGPGLCACCEVWLLPAARDARCKGCPVSKVTRRKYCNGTPYADVTKAPLRADLVTAEYQFLIDLMFTLHEKEG
jgi:hypothetical protein